MYSFPNLEPVLWAMSNSNCSFLTCIQVSQEAGKVVWYSHFFKNFSEFVVIHTFKGFSIFKEAEVDVFLEFSCFFCDPVDVGNVISVSSAFSKSSLNIWKFMVHVLLKPGLENSIHWSSTCNILLLCLCSLANGCKRPSLWPVLAWVMPSSLSLIISSFHLK